MNKPALTLLVPLIVAATTVPVAADDKPASISARYAATADKIIEAATKSDGAYRKLEFLCDGIGHRVSGSEQLDKAIAWAADAMRKDGHENVHTEKVMIPKWVRGEESIVMTHPRTHAIPMLGLGGSVGTPPDGITASVVVARDEAELESLGDKCKGKIVLFNNIMHPYNTETGSGYGTAVRFRGKGARLASEKGAVACLVRSVTAHSLRSPHTGAMNYDTAKTKIPAAAITTEDAEMISRMLSRGEDVRVTIKMQARDHGLVPSANVIGELRGSEKPEEVVVIGGHIDAWDVGDGAHDDGTGCVMSMEAITVLRKLNLKPRRTIRVVLWTNEENGLAGGKQYAKDHEKELAHHVAAIESDSGGFHPDGLTVECKDEAAQARAAKQLREITDLLGSLGPMKITEGHSGADISPMKDGGVVLMGLDVEGSKYFDYHHSHADTFDKVNPKELAECVAAMAVSAYVIADMPERLGQ
jgi:carboxypeptidase Q